MLCQGRSPHCPSTPPSHTPERDSIRSMAPGAGGGWADGWGVQLCVCRYARRGWQQPGFVSYINRKIMFPLERAQRVEEWVSCADVLSISAFLWCVGGLPWVTSEVKLIRVLTGRSAHKRRHHALLSFLPCAQGSHSRGKDVPTKYLPGDRISEFFRDKEMKK